MASFDREGFTDYELEDEGNTLILKTVQDVWKVPIRVYARADKVIANGKVVKDRLNALP